MRREHESGRAIQLLGYRRGAPELLILFARRTSRATHGPKCRQGRSMIRIQDFDMVIRAAPTIGRNVNLASWAGGTGRRIVPYRNGERAVGTLGDQGIGQVWLQP